MFKKAGQPVSERARAKKPSGPMPAKKGMARLRELIKLDYRAMTTQEAVDLEFEYQTLCAQVYGRIAAIRAAKRDARQAKMEAADPALRPPPRSRLTPPATPRATPTRERR